MDESTDQGGELVTPWTGPATWTWWNLYKSRLTELTSTSVKVVEADCRHIVDHGVFGDGAPQGGGWPPSRVRRGLVMGAVQSGKTASMVGVLAMAMDTGVDLAIILGGTRLSLWRQTLGRLHGSLAPNPGSPLTWQVRPTPAGAADYVGGGLDSLYSIGIPAARRCLDKGRPIVLIAMKQVDHLAAVGRTIRGQIAEAANRLGRDLHVLVLDDEADDGSVLDARAEMGLDPAVAELKQIPRYIVDLWDSRPHGGSTLDDGVFVTYIGYTATPQSNFLQHLQNPLSPTDFVMALRTPLDAGNLSPRESTYAEPEGLAAYYTGGELFYRRLATAGICQEVVGDLTSDMVEALRAYLVAAALQTMASADRSSPAVAMGEVFQTRVEAEKRSPRPHSMLVHPSASMENHFQQAAEIVAWCGGISLEEARKRIELGEWGLPTEGLIRDLEERSDEWQRWLTSYEDTARAITQELALFSPPVVPQDWEAVRRCLVNDVLPAARVSVVNSDVRSDDRPNFTVRQSDDGWYSPRDICTIFVSGNVMSRGLTLEGLTTTLFSRSSKDPFADTQMQMQRWFGYRGRYLHLCRVFVSSEQLTLFRAYHDVDEALRRDVITGMASKRGAPSPQVLQGRAFLATGKLANLSNQPLFPGFDPMVRMVGAPGLVDPNLEVVGGLFVESGRNLSEGRHTRGRLLDRQLTLPEAAEMLEMLRYPGYCPGAQGWLGSHWAAVERQIGLMSSDPQYPLYRPPGKGGDQVPARGACPYSLAAYLRLWEVCLSRHARGLYPTDAPEQQWSLLDLALKRSQAPMFNVGLRFGRGPVINGGALSNLPFEIRSMSRTVEHGYLSATWGSRTRNDDGTYGGDQSFDLAPGSKDGQMRRPGDPGLILFHIIHRDEDTPTVAVGLILPLGGPDHFAARITESE